MKEEVKLIPIESIRIVNPRHRDQKKFQAISEASKILVQKGRFKSVCVLLTVSTQKDCNIIFFILFRRSLKSPAATSFLFG